MPATRSSLKRPRSRSPSSSLSPIPTEFDDKLRVKLSPAAAVIPVIPLDALPSPSKLLGTSVTSKKIKLHEAYSTVSPFPTFSHPTSLECSQVYQLLVEAHGTVTTKFSTPASDSNSAKTCGSSRNVIDSLIGTILSQNTSAKNSTAAKRSLDAAFGRANFAAIADAPLKDVIESIRHGGLANKKAAAIQKLLRSIKTKHGAYSLQHLLSPSVSDDEIMKELISYDGVGPKTASCVLLFCIGRQSFAVDTHVFRLSKVLGWLPESVGTDRVKAQAHLDRTVPAELKYGLHVLMVKHGRACKGCKVGGKGECLLKSYRRGSKDTKTEDDVVLLVVKEE